MFKVCWTKLLDYGHDFICLCSSRLEALWAVHLTFVNNVPSMVSLSPGDQVWRSVALHASF